MSLKAIFASACYQASVPAQSIRKVGGSLAEFILSVGRSPILIPVQGCRVRVAWLFIKWSLWCD